MLARRESAPIIGRQTSGRRSRAGSRRPQRERDVVVGEAGDGTQHGREDGRVEARVDLGGTGEQQRRSVALGEDEHVSEVSRFGAVEQGEHLPRGQFFGVEGGAEEAGPSRCSRRCVEGEVDKQVLRSRDDQPAERLLVPDADAGPALLANGRLELVTRVRDRAAASPREEIEIMSRPTGQVLRDQRRATGEQEACAGLDTST
jgi:hypothetical protein